MKCIITYFDLAKRTIIESPVDAKITWGVIQNQTKDVLNRIQDLKQDIKPEWEKNAVMDYTSKLVGDIQESMRKLANRWENGKEKKKKKIFFFYYLIVIKI